MDNSRGLEKRILLMNIQRLPLAKEAMTRQATFPALLRGYSALVFIVFMVSGNRLGFLFSLSGWHIAGTGQPLDPFDVDKRLFSHFLGNGQYLSCKFLDIFASLC